MNIQVLKDEVIKRAINKILSEEEETSIHDSTNIEKNISIPVFLKDDLELTPLKIDRVLLQRWSN